ncbi:hypothetical protein BC938DRAFT_476711, partial [Jimgerdemannia flammicorona]
MHVVHHVRPLEKLKPSCSSLSRRPISAAPPHQQRTGARARLPRQEHHHLQRRPARHGAARTVRSYPVSFCSLISPPSHAPRGTLFGLNQATAKDCISTNCRAAVFHAATRRDTHKSIIRHDPVQSLKPSETWKLGSKRGIEDVADAEGEEEGEEEGEREDAGLARAKGKARTGNDNDMDMSDGP